MSQEKSSAFLGRMLLFRDLSAQELERVEEIAISRAVSKRGIVFTEGSDKEAVFFIQQGWVKTYKTDENGHEQIVSFLKAGDMFPHTGLFNPNPYPATAEAITDTLLLAIPIRPFERLMMATPAIAMKMMRVMGDKIRELQEKLMALSGQDVKNRTISFLQMLAEQHGETQDDKITIQLPMTHQSIANSVGTTRETVNRLLSQWSKDRLLEADRSRIVIFDLDALKRQKEL